MKLHIIVVAYNVAEWITENIEILKKQTHRNFSCLIIDDISTDATAVTAQIAIAGDNRFSLIRNSEKKLKPRNVWDGIALIQAEPEDIILIVDGDDKLAHTKVLAKVVEVYKQTNGLMTYGCYGPKPDQPSKNCQAYQEQIIKKGSYRRNRWLASHLKTFKYKLWCQLTKDIFHITEDEIKKAKVRALITGKWRKYFHWRHLKNTDLMEETGQFTKRIDDKAFTLPMLEMARERAIFIPEVLYIYRTDIWTAETRVNFGPKNASKWHTRLLRDILFHKPSYPKLPANF